MTPTSSGKHHLFGKRDSLKVVSVSDIHLFHRRTPTPDILKGLYQLIKDGHEMATWDLFVIPGDLFDLLGSLNNPYLDEVIEFFVYFLKKCHRHDVAVRLLEGTPAHDFKQSQLMATMNNVFFMLVNDGVDFKYVSELSIEYMEKYNLHILYVPDEWEIDPMSTYDQVLQLMRDKHLDQVDFCLLHGAFNYQIDESLNPKAHQEKLWCPLVKYYLFAGHVHFPSQYENILVSGSFDRLAHGEEQPKGWISVEIKASGEHEILFHENSLATKYLTLDVRNKTHEEALAIVEAKVKDLPPKSHLRLHSTDRDAVTDAINVLKKQYPAIHFTAKVEKQDALPVKQLQLVSKQFEAISLNPDNLKRLLDERLNQYPEIDKQHVLSLFEQYTQGR